MRKLLRGLGFEDPRMERAYRTHSARKHAGAVRLGLALALALYVAFGALDLLLAPAQLGFLWGLRFGVVCPILLCVLVMAQLARDRFEGAQQELMVLVSLVGGLGIVAMIAVAQPPASHSYYAGLMLVLVFIHTLSRLRFLPAIAVSSLLVFAYEAVALLGGPTPAEVLLPNNFFFLSTAAMGALASYTMERMDREAFVDMRTIEELSVRDHLTGLYNRRHLDARLAELIALAQRYRVHSCLVLMDLDGFKQVNDRLGHPAGDTVLVEVSRVLLTSARATDLAFRFGGDEFCLLLPNTDEPAALAMMDRVRAALRANSFGDERPLTVDLSGGCVRIDGARQEVADVIAAAAERLLAAKQQGKGRVLGSG